MMKKHFVLGETIMRKNFRSETYVLDEKIGQAFQDGMAIKYNS